MLDEPTPLHASPSSPSHLPTCPVARNAGRPPRETKALESAAEARMAEPPDVLPTISRL